MKDLFRLLRYARRYWPHLIASVLLMACVGAAHALVALLIGPIFDRVLNPGSPDAPVLLFNNPGFRPPALPHDHCPLWRPQRLDHGGIWLYHGVSGEGYLRLLWQLPGELRRLLRRYRSAQYASSTSCCGRARSFSKRIPPGRLMSSVMNDIEKIQVATSHILADLLRQTFVAIGLLFVVMHKDWKLALVSLTVLPFVLVPTARIGRRIRRTTRRAQDHAAELNEILQETISGHQVVKSFGTEPYECGRFRGAARRLLQDQPAIRTAAGAGIAADRAVRRRSPSLALLTYARSRSKPAT